MAAADYIAGRAFAAMLTPDILSSVDVISYLCGGSPCIQVLQDAKTRLRDEILSRLDAAKKQKDHASVLRFTRLYAPLGLQVCPALPSSAQQPRPPLVPA